MLEPLFSTGSTTTIAAGLGTFFVAALAAWQKYQGSKTDEGRQALIREEQLASDASRVHLDAAQREFLDRIMADNSRYRAEAHAAQQKCELMEMRARRADRIAHELWHQLANANMCLGKNEKLPPIPLLEDPFVE